MSKDWHHGTPSRPAHGAPPRHQRRRGPRRALETFNGRDANRDLVEELVDATQYALQDRLERQELVRRALLEVKAALDEAEAPKAASEALRVLALGSELASLRSELSAAEDKSDLSRTLERGTADQLRAKKAEVEVANKLAADRLKEVEALRASDRVLSEKLRAMGENLERVLEENSKLREEVGAKQAHIDRVNEDVRKALSVLAQHPSLWAPWEINSAGLAPLLKALCDRLDPPGPYVGPLYWYSCCVCGADVWLSYDVGGRRVRCARSDCKVST